MPDEWYNSFPAFWRDVQNGYRSDLTIDRRDNNASYSRSNYRWVDMKTQQRNKRDNVHVDSPWGRVTLAEAAERSGLKYITMHKRYVKGDRGKELFRPVKQKSTISSTVDPLDDLL